MTVTSGARTRLESWKEIAAHLRRSERTVMRWERERGLPVHRVPGLDKSRVYAEIAELEAWRRDQPAPTPLTGEDGPPASAQGLRAPALAMLARTGIITLAITVVVVVAVVMLRDPILRLARPPPSLAAQRLYLGGMDDWAKRTPEGLNRAVGEFSGAIARDPDYAEAYAGLAASYDLMREYTLMPPSQAYQLATAAAQKALALDDRLSNAHAALAFAEFYGAWKTAAARYEFRRAVELDPRNETAHHWRATFLLALGDNKAALEEIESARALDPTSLAIAADHAFILYANGGKVQAVSELQAIEAAHPEFLSPHNYLAGIDFDQGDDPGYLRESVAAAELEHDRVREALIAAASAGFQAGGHTAMLATMARELTDEFQAGAASAYSLARTWALLGDRQKSLDYLRLAIDRRDSDAIGFTGDDAFASLRGDADFQRLVKQAREA
jgi:Tfp pilus assembly protein PilF